MVGKFATSLVPASRVPLWCCLLYYYAPLHFNSPPHRTTPTMPYDVEHEIKLVQYHIARIGKQEPDGSYKITFGEFFADEEVEQVFESLVGSLKAAKRKGLLKFDGQMLLMPVHAGVVLHLVEPLPAGYVVDWIESYVIIGAILIDISCSELAQYLCCSTNTY
jgi:hypothetical protein